MRFFQRSQNKEEKLRAENGQILHYLQNLLISASLASLSAPSHLHQVFICGTYILLQLQQLWNVLWEELAQEGPYVVGGIRLRLHKLQAKDKQARKARAEYPEGWDKIKGILHYEGFPNIPETIRTELISRHHNNSLAGHFDIKKTCKLVAQKYYWSTLCRGIKNYVKGCDICLASKAVQHKPYGDLQSLPVSTHRWKDLSMDFVTSLSILTDWKRDSYDSIFVIVNWLTKMVYYKPVKVIIDNPSLAEVIIDIVMRHHGLPDSIITDWGSLFTLKFWSLLCYFISIKWKLFIAFYLQIDGQTERQNSIMKAYLWAFVNFEQNNWAWLLPMAEFAYNNIKNASTSFTLFELNCRYHP